MNKTKETLRLIFISYIFLICVITIPFEIVKNYYAIHLGGVNFGTTNIYIIFIAVVIIGPLIETFIFQIGIIKLFTHLFPKTPTLSIFISALLFALSHYYNIYYVIYTFIMGLMLGKIYFISVRKKVFPEIVIFSIHALYNFTVFVIKEII